MLAVPSRSTTTNGNRVAHASISSITVVLRHIGDHGEVRGPALSLAHSNRPVRVCVDDDIRSARAPRRARRRSWLAWLSQESFVVIVGCCGIYSVVKRKAIRGLSVVVRHTHG
jgi:hypothetical protein